MNREVIALRHGGPITVPSDFAFILEKTDVEGFVGGSSMQRLPVQTAIESTTRAFKALLVKGEEFRCRHRGSVCWTCTPAKRSAGQGAIAREGKEQVKELKFAQIGSGLMGKAYAPALAQIPMW